MTIVKTAKRDYPWHEYGFPHSFKTAADKSRFMTLVARLLLPYL